MTESAPKYWLTTHNPHRGPALNDWGMYLRPTDRNSEREPRQGDKVLIYEQATGEIDGKRVSGGSGGIVAVAEIVSGWKQRITHTPFTLEAECGGHDWSGIVPLDVIGPAMGSKGRFPIRGIGKGSGIMPLSADEFGKLVAAFKANPRR